MNYNEKKARLNELYYSLFSNGKVKNKKDLAEKIGVSYSHICGAFGSNERSLTPTMLEKIENLVKESGIEAEESQEEDNKVRLIPIGARGGSLLEYSEGVMGYECEKIVSPVKGADYAIQVTGDSMTPDYPSGSHIFIKKVDDKVFLEWGKVYVLDTTNGVVLKEIHPTDDEDVIRCVSINPKYAPYNINKEYIYGFYKVLMVMALK